MSSVGTASPRPIPPTRRLWTSWLIVLLLAAGVVGMHSLGASHHGGSVMAVAPMASDHRGAHPAAADPASSTPSAAALGPAWDVVRALPAGSGLAVCLAVLPFLGLLLRRRGRADLGLTIRGSARSGRPVTARRQRAEVQDVSLWRLGVLRT